MPRSESMTPYEDYISHSFWGRIQYRLVWHVMWWTGRSEMSAVRPWKWNKENNG